MAFGRCVRHCEHMDISSDTICAPACKLDNCKPPFSKCYHPPEALESQAEECKCPEGTKPFRGFCATKCLNGMVETSLGDCICPKGTTEYSGRCLGHCPPSQTRLPNGGCGCHHNQVRILEQQCSADVKN